MLAFFLIVLAKIAGCRILSTHKTKEAMAMKRKQFLKAVRTHITITSLAALLFAGVAVADGTHGVKVTVKNNHNNQIEVQTFNYKGGGGWGSVPHKVYYIGSGGERNVKAHGQGHNEIKLIIHETGSGDSCDDDDGKSYYFTLVKNNTTITITNCSF